MQCDGITAKPVMERNAKVALDPLLHILDCRAKYEAGVYTRFYRSDPGCKAMLGPRQWSTCAQSRNAEGNGSRGARERRRATQHVGVAEQQERALRNLLPIRTATFFCDAGCISTAQGWPHSILRPSETGYNRAAACE